MIDRHLRRRRDKQRCAKRDGEPKAFHRFAHHGGALSDRSANVAYTTPSDGPFPSADLVGGCGDGNLPRHFGLQTCVVVRLHSGFNNAWHFSLLCRVPGKQREVDPRANNAQLAMARSVAVRLSVRFLRACLINPNCKPSLGRVSLCRSRRQPGAIHRNEENHLGGGASRRS